MSWRKNWIEKRYGYASIDTLFLVEKIFKEHGICCNFILYHYKPDGDVPSFKNGNPLYGVVVMLPPTYHKNYNKAVERKFNSVAINWILEIKRVHSLGSVDIVEIVSEHIEDKEYPNKISVFWQYK